MSQPANLRPEARQDIFDACEWHEAVRPGLGVELKLCVYDCIDKIQANPERFSRMLRAVRRAKVKRFRYYVIYEILNNAVEIYAVFHTSRSQKTLRRRLRKER